MTMPALRPLGFGEILDRAFTLYRRNLVLFLGTSLLLSMGVFIGVILLIGMGGVVMSVMPGVLGWGAMALMVVGAGALATIPWGALARQASQTYTGQRTSLGDGAEAGGRAAMTLLGAGLVAALSVGVLMFLVGLVSYFLNLLAAGPGLASVSVVVGFVTVVGTIAAFVAVASLYFGVLPAVVVEDKGPLEAVSRSLELAQGALPRIAGTMVVSLLIVYLPLVAVGVATGLFAATSTQPGMGTPQLFAVVLQLGLNLLIPVLTTPFLVNVMVVLYYDRRVRSEALDVQMVTERLGLAPA